MIKIHYNVFKVKDKLNLIKNNSGEIEESFKEVPDYCLDDDKKDNMKVWLTKLDRSECDTVYLSTYNPQGQIEDTIFDFYHFDYKNKEHYSIKIKNIKEKSKIFERLLGGSNKRYWKITVSKLDSKEGKEIAICEERDINTQESLEIEKILNSRNGVKGKIFSLIKSLKYNRIKLKYEQQQIYSEIRKKEEAKINGIAK